MANSNGLEALGKWGTLRATGFVPVVLVFFMLIIFVLLADRLGWVDNPTRELVAVISAQTRIMEIHQKNTDLLRTELLAVLNDQNVILRALCYRMPEAKAPCEEITRRRID